MENYKWWKNAIIYQIYPRSFKDANNDGVGDLRGIIEELDYLAFLGVDAIWLSPIYESPMEDMGYDVSDYFKIAPVFGSMEDMEELIEEGKKRNIKIIMDLVANHTSKEHKWFKEACKSVDNPYHDYFYWSDKADDKESSFCGSSWEYVEELGLYYYHYFAKVIFKNIMLCSDNFLASLSFIIRILSHPTIAANICTIKLIRNIFAKNFVFSNFSEF